MKKDYGICRYKGIQKPFIWDKSIVRGKHKGKVRVWLTRGRSADGSIIKGQRVFIDPKDIVECPGDLRVKGVE